MAQWSGGVVKGAELTGWVGLPAQEDSSSLLLQQQLEQSPTLPPAANVDITADVRHWLCVYRCNTL